MSLDNQSINGESKGSVETIDDDGADGVSMSAGTSDGERREFHKQKSILKQGHLRVKEDGQKVYKKTPSQAIMDATQLGIGYSVGRLSAKPERDVLMGDFYFVEKVWFPSSGSKETPSHKFYDFRFKTYAPVAFRYFRDLFGIQPSDFMLSLANEPIREISNPGASGSLFFVSNDDMFIVKTVTNKEASFLQKLLPGYYMNIHQNVRTLLPKFFGLYCYQSGNSNIRLTVMNNLLPSKYKCHMKFDLKGSTYKRKANKAERGKKSPTYKDLDFISMFPDGLPLDAETYDAVIKTISKDVRVLESFKIMDYSFLLGVHNIDKAEQERAADLASPSSYSLANPEREARRNEFSAALEAIQLNKEGAADVRPAGGIPAKNDDGERLILFLGIIDILQNYRFAKKMEHGWKSMITDGDSVSVHKPSFYAKRFLDFIKDRVFKRVGVQRTSTKRRSYRASNTQQPDRISERDQEMGDVPKEPGPGTYTPPSGDKPKGKVVTIRDPEVSPEHDLSITEDTSENPPSQQVNEPTESTSDLSTAVSEPSASEPSMSDIPAASEMPSGADIPSASNIPSTSEPSETSSRAETPSESGPSQVYMVEASSSVAVSDHQVNHSESATQGKTASFGEIKINIQQNESKTFKLNSVETTNVPSEASASPTVSHGDSSSHDDTSVVAKRPPENVLSVEDSQL